MSDASGHELSGRRVAVLSFIAFAFAYFFSALLRAITATLAPVFSAELGLGAADLGLLAGAYFLGFAVMQLPLGRALDRYGPKRVLLVFLSIAVVACAAFALADSFVRLLAARALIGVGVAACLMAPLTSFRLRYNATAQLRANSWMLMTGSLGMLASTLPVQWLLPLLGWRALFWGVALLLIVAMGVLALAIPKDRPTPVAAQDASGGYALIARQATFVRYAPMGFFHYGGLLAVQSLWAGPWLTEVAGWTPLASAQGLFAINLSMLCAFLSWGVVMPRLVARGVHPQQLIAWGAPVSIAILVLAIALGSHAGAVIWALWCVSCTTVSLSQPAVGQAVAAELAGRALSAYNLVIFAGVFCVQWGVGLAVDALREAGWTTENAYRGAFGLLALCVAAAYVWFLVRREPVADHTARTRGVDCA